jgi:DNA replication protein DnaC
MLAEKANLKPVMCPVCGGTGWELVEGKGVRPCECQREGRGDVLLAQSRIPARFMHCTVDTFDPICPSLHRALMNTRKFVDEYPLVDVGLLYLGSCGVGKTHLAVAALKELIRKGIAGMFYDFRDLLKEIQDSYNPNTHNSELKILAPIFEAEVLVLDELGASKPTEWVQETMTHIINKRYNEKKTTIFTSNYLDMPIGSSYDETLTERVGVRLRSRLQEMCRLIPVEGDDYRELIKNKRGGKFSYP